MRRFCLFLATFALLATIAREEKISQAAEQTYRLYDGITAFIDNPTGKDFSFTLDVRDINIYETGPREVLLKIYDPDGNPVVRQVIPDDGVTTKAFQPPMGAWDHEAWYYAYIYMQGTEPMIRWSAFAEPDRLNAVPKRTFKHAIPGGKPGVYRAVIVGTLDHFVTLNIDPALKFSLSGHCDFLCGSRSMYRKSYAYVPKGTRGFHFAAIEYDAPRNRKYIIKAPDGKVLYEGNTASMFAKGELLFPTAGMYDDQLITLEVTEGPGDFGIELKWRLEKDPEVKHRGERVVAAVLAADEATAKATHGGAIYHDGHVFWQPYQVRFHDWLKKKKPEEFEVKNEDGELADPAVIAKLAPLKASNAKAKPLPSLPTVPDFIPLNGVYWAPPLSDRIMHNYSAHKNKAALNVALRDLAAGFNSIGPNDHIAIATSGPFANMAYEFGNYAFQYWRPAWRILQQSDAPDDVKAIVRETLITCGDRLAFCRSWERVNGNAYAQLVSALRYCSAATGDPLQKELFDTYWDRFEKGGWGERVGVGPSGPIQEGFGYAYHYGSYIMSTWQSVNADFKDERFLRVYDRIRTWYSYTLADERIPAGPWSSRTHHYPAWQIEKEGPYTWKGLPGPDFTLTVNGANEFFAARRKNYYVLTYHSRLSPAWNANTHVGQTGYGGGMLCQVHVPGRGPVIASTLNGEYGEHMHPSLWRTFHIHTVVGQTADGRPLVAANSEHLDAKMEGNTVTSSGDVRESSVRTTRQYTFGNDDIACEVRLHETGFNELLSLWVKNPMRGKLTEAYEMIPFVPNQLGKSGAKREPTAVTLVDADGKTLGELSKEPTTAKTIVIDRGGFGVKIELEAPRPVFRGEKDTVMIQLIEKPTPASEVSLRYRLRPFNNL